MDPLKQQSNEEISSDILELQHKQIMIVRTFIWVIFILTFIFTFVTLYLYKSWNDIINKLNSALYPTQNELQKLSEFVWDVPENDSGAEIINLITRIWNLESEDEKISKNLSNDIDNKVNNLKWALDWIQSKVIEIEDSISWTWKLLNPQLQEKINSLITESNNLLKIDIQKTISETNWNTKIDDINQKLEDIQKVLDEDSNIDFGKNWEKTWDAIRILLNKVLKLQYEVEDLKNQLKEKKSEQSTSFEEESNSNNNIVKYNFDQSKIDFFKDKFKNCESWNMQASMEMNGIVIEYYHEIISQEWDLCKVLSKIIQSPDQRFNNKEMTCLLDNKKDFDTASQDVISSFKLEEKLWSCKWELYDLMISL